MQKLGFTIVGVFVGLALIAYAPVTHGQMRYTSGMPGDTGDSLIVREPVSEASESWKSSQEPGVVAELTAAWSYHTLAPALGSPKFAEVTGDGKAELLVTTYDPVNPYAAGRVYVFTSDGTLLSGWPTTTAGPIPGSVAVGDIDNDGTMEVVAGSWQRAYVWNADGTEYPGWPKFTGTYGTPVLRDLDGDGDLEILYAATAKQIQIWHHDGSHYSGFPVSSPELLTSPVVGDVDGDGQVEIVSTTYEGPVGPTPFDVYVWNLDGTVASGFPFAMSGVAKVPAVLADVDGDDVLDIIAVSYHTSNEDYLYAIDGFGNVKSGWPVRPRYGRLSSPSVGDVDGDGHVEIVIGGFSLTGLEIVYVYNHDGSTVPGSPFDLTHPFPPSANVNSTPILADVDGDPSRVEIIAKVRDHVVAIRGDGSVVDGFPYMLTDENHTGTTSPAPAVGDVDGDGLLEMAFVSNYGNVVYFQEEIPYYPCYEFWPMFKRDAYSSGVSMWVYTPGDTDCDGDVDLVDVVQLQICFTGMDGGPIEWMCDRCDFDFDTDVDGADYGEFYLAMTGP